MPLAREDDPGHVKILQLGAATGAPLTVSRELTLSQDDPGVPGGDEPGDGFGRSVAVGDVDRDGHADLAVGANGEDDDSGRVTVVHGAAGGWRTSGNRSYSQDTRGVPGVAEDLDGFGTAVTLVDHDRDGRRDLTVGAPGENDASGAVTTLRGAGTGFTATGSRTFGLATLGHPAPADARFGASLGRQR